MRVRIAITVEVDPDEWRNAYGGGMTPAEVREDVRAYVANTLASLPVPLVPVLGSSGGVA